MGERVPQHVQNLVIRDYAKRNGLVYKLSATEYAMPGSDMMLMQVLDELPELEGVICYSLFQLPVNAECRRHVFAEILRTGSRLHAAVEQMVVASAEDVELAETIWSVRSALDACPSAAEMLAATGA